MSYDKVYTPENEIEVIKLIIIRVTRRIINVSNLQIHLLVNNVLVNNVP